MTVLQILASAKSNFDLAWGICGVANTLEEMQKKSKFDRSWGIGGGANILEVQKKQKNAFLVELGVLTMPPIPGMCTNKKCL